MPAPSTFRLVEGKHTFQAAAIPSYWETMTPAEARGIVWLFEEPNPKATYVVGVDTAQGITGWDRSVVGDDQDRDNSAVEVFRVGSREELVVDKDSGEERLITIPTDYQVAEFAAPVDYEATAAIVNALGRLYCGNGSMGAAHTIIEVYPGPGWMVEKTLIQKYGYLNFYQPKRIDTIQQKAGTGIGWQATQKSVRDLWILGTRQVINKSLVLRSPWLINEMETTDPIKFMQYTSEAASGFHDDRLRAFMLCLWAAHDFSSMIKVETKTTVERNAKPVNWQMSDLSHRGLMDAWEQRFQELLDE
jgi:hypothetical protein